MFENLRRKKGQLSFEYLVIIGGVIVFSVIILTVVRNILNQNTTDISNTRSIVTNNTCISTSESDPISLIAYYRFDEIVGNYSRDSSKNALDLSGAYNSFGGAGVNGNSLMRTTSANSTSSSRLSLNGPFSIIFYMKLPSSSSTLNFLLGNQVAISLSNGNITAYQALNSSASNYTFNVTRASTFAYNSWMHVAIVFDSSSFSSYVNLVSVNNSLTSGVGSQALGLSQILNLNVSNTYLDEVKIYNRALSLNEITNDASCLR